MASDLNLCSRLTGSRAIGVDSAVFRYSRLGGSGSPRPACIFVADCFLRRLCGSYGAAGIFIVEALLIQSILFGRNAKGS